MAETLYIRLGSQKQDKVHWLIYASGEQTIIASGELSDAQQLSVLTDKAQQRQVTVFVPGCDVTLKSLKVPGKSQRSIRQAAPYMLEDGLAQDVDQLFFAYANIKHDQHDNNCFVAVVEKAQLIQWQTWLEDAAIDCQLMLPDMLAMPVAESASSAIVLDQQLILRQSQWQGMTLDLSSWPVICQSLSASNAAPESADSPTPALNIQAYSCLPESAYADKLNLTAMPEVLPLALLAEHGENQKFNLLQGQFKKKQQTSPVLVNWSWAAGLLLFALLMNMALKGTELIRLNAQQAAIEQQIVKLYKSAFPDKKRVRINLIKSQLKQELSRLGSGSQGAGFLTMLAKLQPAFASVPALKPEGLKFDAKRRELRLQAVASDYQHFEQFKAALEKSNLTVSQGAQNNQDGQVSGSFSIKGKI